MVFGNAPGLHHLRHRSHEPQVNEGIWGGDSQRRPTLSRLPSSADNSSHPSLSMEITPLDVESPSMSPDTHLRFFPSILANHRSTPTTPAEETGYRKRLLDAGPVNGGLPLDWKGMTFTLLDSSSADHEGLTESSPTCERQSPTSSILGDDIIDDSNRVSLTITPPSTPSFSTTSLGSPTLTFSSRGAIKDASGTRRMMLKRKSSSSLRASASQPEGETGSRSSHVK
jgi:hypothetical protein